MKISTINIRYKNENDGINHWRFRLPLIQAFVKNNQFSFMATQEGRKNQIYELANSIPLSIVDSHREWIEERMYPTIFYNSHQLTLISSGDIWLSTTPNIPGSSDFKSSFPRLLTWAIFNYKNNKFIVANFHLDHVLNSTRIEQVKVGINELKKIASDLPIIVMGDFNDNPNGNVQNEITQKLNLQDPWREKQLEEVSSHHNFTGENLDGCRIDWILISSQFTCNEIYMEKKSLNGTFLTDHFPVVATVIPNWT